MLTFKELRVPGYERVSSFSNATANLHGVVAIHSTVRGPGAGGCRMWRYGSGEEATADALRLAEGMSRKNAMADLPLGGAKAVIMAPAAADRWELFAAFGEVVEQLGGAYITAEDVGTSVDDMRHVARTTSFVSGITSGDPSPWTARGVFFALREAVRMRLGRDDLLGLRAAVQGAGHVGSALCRLLRQAGAELTISDPNAAALKRLAAEVGARIVPPHRVLDVECDVFAPCALGNALDDDAMPRLSAAVVCGAANNQLSSDKVGHALHVHNILYVPDYIANAGGIISVAGEYLNWTRGEVEARVAALPFRVREIVAESLRQGRPPHLVADALAARRLKPLQPAAVR